MLRWKRLLKDLVKVYKMHKTLKFMRRELKQCYKPI